MKVCLAAAERFPYGDCLPGLRKLLRELPDDTTLLIRGTTPEMAIAILAKKTRRFPFVQYPGGRREANFHRDIRMVADADLVLCLFHEDSIGMEGTGHVMEKALDKLKATVCYTCSSGQIKALGFND